MAVVIAATVGNAAEAGQRQRSPGHNGGGQGRGNGGGQAQSSGGGSQQDSGGSQSGGSQSAPRYAAPRENRGGGGERGDGGRARAERGVRDNGGARQEAAAPPQETRSAPADQGSRQVQRWPNARVESRTETRSEVAPQTTVEQRSGSVIRRDQRAVETRNSNGGSTGRVAIPRQGPGPQRRDGRYAYGGYTYSSGGRYYTYAPRYYYSPRYYTYRPYYFYRPNIYTAFSFGYGPYGRGLFYYDTFYDSYVFYPHTIARYGDYGRYGYPTGNLRLDIEPRDAQVYIDGAYAGLVDDFDGVFQSLRLEAGEYHVEVVLPGFETLAFDVRIFPGEKTTYRGDLLPERP
jgi:PEGA domain-containing protein